jgi:hypothetical protein
MIQTKRDDYKIKRSDVHENDNLVHLKRSMKTSLKRVLSRYLF